MPGRADPILLPRALAGPAAAPADPRRGAPLRDHLPPPAPRRRRARVDVRPARGRRAGPAARAAAALRLGRARARGDRRRSSRACPACPRRPRAGSTRSCTGRAALTSRAGPARPAAALAASSAPGTSRRTSSATPRSASGTWFQNLAASHARLPADALRLPARRPQLLPVRPGAVLSPWAGGLADRFDRRRLLLATQIALDRAERGARRARVGGAAPNGSVIALLGRRSASSARSRSRRSSR